MSIGRNFFNHPSLPQPRRRDCDLMDSSDSSLPSGSSITIDGVLVSNGMKVLFTNLSSNNNEVYRASFALDTPNPPVVWQQVLDAGSAGPAPLSSDLMHVIQGASNGGRLLVYNNAWEDADLMIERQLQVGDSSAATTPGSVTKKMPVYDNAGNLLGYIAIYSSIS